MRSAPTSRAGESRADKAGADKVRPSEIHGGKVRIGEICLAEVRADKDRADKDRLELLRGYLDGDGSIKADGNIRMSTASERLADDIQKIVRSLGGECKIARITNKTYIYQGVATACRNEYRINGIALRINPFWLSRKADRYVFSQKSMNQFRRIRSVKIVEAPVIRGPLVPQTRSQIQASRQDQPP